MKRTLVICTILSFLIVLCSCTRTESNYETTSEQTSTLQSTTTYPDVGDTPYGYTQHVHYYYRVMGLFRDIAGSYEYSIWIDEEKPVFDDFHEMALVQFIKQFNISREQFDAVNDKWTEDRGKESPFNADIIYTFDNELISDYYSVENFVIELPPAFQ